MAQLLAFHDSDIKFDLRDLMGLLRDRRHEGWVLAAYPDPKTADPLIGAGFTLNLPARSHPQSDPLNPHSFVEPSSAELWQAAGLDPNRLQAILVEFNQHLSAWNKKGYRKRIRTLSPQITEDDATQLLRIAAIQTVINAKAYCRNYDQLSGPQQMALSQLVYQMGINLEEFTQFLGMIRTYGSDASTSSVIAPSAQTSAAADPEYWKTVQQTLIQSQWARLYRVRATSVIAMLDPRYSDDPAIAERRVGAILRPTVAHRRRSGASVRLTATSAHRSRPTGKKATRARSKRRA